MVYLILGLLLVFVLSVGQVWLVWQRTRQEKMLKLWLIPRWSMAIVGLLLGLAALGVIFVALTSSD